MNRELDCAIREFFTVMRESGFSVVIALREGDWNWGTLDQLDPVTGAPQRRYEIVPGTEGIAFGNAGRLWAVSEAGSRHIYDHPFLDLFQPFFPLVFALDLSRLE